MSQDIEKLLGKLMLTGPAPELRGRVLAAVGDALADTSTPTRRRLRLHPALGVSAALLASLMLNHLVNTTMDRRLAAVLGPPPIPRQAADIAADIAGLTDSRTGRWAFERLAASRGEEGDAELYPLRLRQMIHQLMADSKEPPDETPQEDIQVDRDRRGSFDRHRPGAERCLRLEHRNTA